MLELTFFYIVLGISGACYLGGIFFRTPHLFLFGSIGLVLTAALLYGAGGLITSHYYLEDGTLGTISMSMGELSMQLMTLILIAVGIVSIFVTELGSVNVRKPNPFHF